MNTFSRLRIPSKISYPAVYLADCDGPHQSGDVIDVETRRGTEVECEIVNLIEEEDGHYYYSIIRLDGMNRQEWAKRRAERLQNRATSCAKKSEEYFEKSERYADFLKLGEPIKMGHHSEKWHRKVIEDSNRNIEKSVEASEQAGEHMRKAEYWEKKAGEIHLSMPESLPYYRAKLAEAVKYHSDLKTGIVSLEHAYSLAYAKKKVNELTERVRLATILWGSFEDLDELENGGCPE